MPVRWKWDGKTVELSNEEPATYQETQGGLLDLVGRASSDQERADILRAYGYPASEERVAHRPTRGEGEQATREQKREWRKQLDAYYKGMRDVERGKAQSFDSAAGMQELLDSGAAWEEEDGGLGSYVRGRGGRTRNEAMVRAHDAYVDFMHGHGNTAYDPDMGWYNPDIGLPMVPDSSGRLIIKRPDGFWAPAFGEGVINEQYMTDAERQNERQR